MSTNNATLLRSQIMDAVEALRQRKTKPDRETIAHYVLKRYFEQGLDFQQIFTELENTVDEGGLLKVEYKGTTSYRHPSNFDQKASPLLTKHSKILNSTKTTRLIISTMTELWGDVNSEGGGLWSESGIPLELLQEKLTEIDPVRFAIDKVFVCLDREFCCSNSTIVLVNKNRELVNLTNKGGSAGGGKGMYFVWWSKDLNESLNKESNNSNNTTPSPKTKLPPIESIPTRRSLSKRKSSPPPPTIIEEEEEDPQDEEEESKIKVPKLRQVSSESPVEEEAEEETPKNGHNSNSNSKGQGAKINPKTESEKKVDTSA